MNHSGRPLPVGPAAKRLFVETTKIFDFQNINDPNGGEGHATPFATKLHSGDGLGPYVFKNLHPGQLRHFAAQAAERFEADTGKKAVVTGYFNVSEASPEMAEKIEQREKQLEEKQQVNASCSCGTKDGAEQQVDNQGVEMNNTQNRVASPSTYVQSKLSLWRVRRQNLLKRLQQRKEMRERLLMTRQVRGRGEATPKA